MYLKIPLWSLKRTPNQDKDILRNRYVFIFESKELICEIVHEVLFTKNEWHSGYSWCTIGLHTRDRALAWKDEVPAKTFLFGLLKRYEDYYDGPIVTWRLGPFYMNYRW